MTTNARDGSSVFHVACFRWSEGKTPEQAETLTAALAALRGQIRVRDFQFGPDLGLATGNADFAVLAVFESTADFEIYRDHPEHRRILEELIRPHLADRSAVQFAESAI